MCILFCFYVASAPAAHVRGRARRCGPLDQKFAPSALARVEGVCVDATPSPRRPDADPLLRDSVDIAVECVHPIQGR